MDRRVFLRRAAVLGAVGLAGCASDDDETTDTPGDGGAQGTTEGDGTMDDPTTTSEMGTEGTGTTEPTTDGTATESMDDGTETSEATAEPTAEQTDEATTAPTESEPQESVTVAVGVDGRSRFGPETFTLAQGGTVTWEWNQPGHNVVPDSQPSGASFEGTPGGESETYGPDYSHEETFDTAGEYEYVCSVHEEFGMVGSFTVE
ncbi:plastocyanin/azurin family copper-binding protein [Halomarina rubra]|uniref:Plastocyanin/azurin family copper-binding protein n=1 Tax=Halomarina rubra TaxID=2071873 RepID=A0ABD6AV06_9EURY|nr:plastocyanin/azurin family copper-binding protein [Halomarina rubra]